MTIASQTTVPPVGVWCSTKTLAQPFPEVVEFLGLLEDLGIRMFWVPESFGREVMSLVALLLDNSRDLIIGTGIANLWARDPVAMANGIRTLEEVHPGRVVFGIGVSHAPNIARRGQVYSSPMQTMRDYLSAMASAGWDGPSLASRAPVLLAALGPRMLELAAETADGAHPYLVTPEHTARAREILGPDAILAPEQGVLLETDASRAREAGRRHLVHYLDRDNYQRSFLRQGFAESDLADGGSDRLVDAIVAWGDPEQVAGRVRQHLDAGADHVTVQLVADGLTGTAEGIQRLAPLLLESA
jgi:probable F420-dependent oxidoreductase